MCTQIRSVTPHCSQDVDAFPPLTRQKFMLWSRGDGVVEALAPNHAAQVDLWVSVENISFLWQPRILPSQEGAILAEINHSDSRLRGRAIASGLIKFSSTHFEIYAIIPKALWKETGFISVVFLIFHHFRH